MLEIMCIVGRSVSGDQGMCGLIELYDPFQPSDGSYIYTDEQKVAMWQAQNLTENPCRLWAMYVGRNVGTAYGLESPTMALWV